MRKTIALVVAGKFHAPAQMGSVLAKQSAELQKYERYAATIAKLDRMKAKTETAISQALDAVTNNPGAAGGAISLTQI